MQALYALIEQIAPYDLPVLLTGESGVGKERFADAIQFISERSSKPYLKVNCAALTPSLVESELFGHTRGAFTGATTDRPGRFEEADTGTIVLDEVGELPFSVQAKLLRVVQNGEIQRLGEDRTRKVDVRILAATNRDIEQEVANGTFREDLYYRLAGVRVHVPPLRERVEDIPLLVEHFLLRFSEKATTRGKPKSLPQITSEVLTELTQREWRGNVRELENTLRLAFIRVPDGQKIQLEHLNVPGSSKMVPALPPSLAAVELDAIQSTLERCGGNVSATAKMLGIDRTTLWRKLKKAQAS
jgi:two-component system response regulator HydG